MTMTSTIEPASTATGTSLILASASPRRRELLARVCPGFRVVVSPLDEPQAMPTGATPEKWAIALAYYKARAVADQNPEQWVLGADTLVACGGEILGKPRDATDARRMLALQAGRHSDVITGVCLMRCDPPTRRAAAVVTRVWMRNDPQVVDEYIASGEWEGKAGAYGIQDVADRLIERIEGSFSNVVGLPLEAVKRILTELRLCA
jgi:septum formation protein